jgi:hypothetical protein
MPGPSCTPTEQPAVELDCLHRLSRDRTVSPLIRPLQPGQADDVAAPEHLDNHGALARHEHVEGGLARVDEPEYVGRAAFLEEPVQRRKADVVRELG